MRRTPSRTVCIIQHVAAEPPGLIGEVLRAGGWELRTIRTYRREAVPDRLESDRGLVIMGGPMGVYDTDQCPFLVTEQRLIADALALRRPVLGICLGSQLLAAALGAAVVSNQRREIGWHPVHFTRAAAKDELWRNQADDLVAFHWHGDRFNLPKGAVPLAWSALTECQAFRWGETAYGILFHLEMKPRAIARMTREFQAEMFVTGQRPGDILEDAPNHLPHLERVGREVFRRWAGMLESE
jgi:GMP synthase (glutamine-hydrolysing)